MSTKIKLRKLLNLFLHQQSKLDFSWQQWNNNNDIKEKIKNYGNNDNNFNISLLSTTAEQSGQQFTAK